jgi:hypothetical protein
MNLPVEQHQLQPLRQQLLQFLQHLMQHQLLPLHLQVEIRFAVTE